MGNKRFGKRKKMNEVNNPYAAGRRLITPVSWDIWRVKRCLCGWLLFLA